MKFKKGDTVLVIGVLENEFSPLIGKLAIYVDYDDADALLPHLVKPVCKEEFIEFYDEIWVTNVAIPSGLIKELF
jgi:hypothetical protein